MGLAGLGEDMQKETSQRQPLPIAFLWEVEPLLRLNDGPLHNNL
jgi:hypothetical protein